MKKYKILFAALILLLLAPVFSYAASIEELKMSIQTAFKWVLGIAGILAAVSFAVGGVQYIISDHAGGKERMLGSVLGLVLIFGSWLLLQTINPQLTKLNLEPLPGGPGIFYVKGTEKAPAPMEEADLSKILEKGYTEIEYTCLDPKLAPKLLIWRWAKPNYELRSGVYSDGFDRISCGSKYPLNRGSYKMSFETPGVYFYMGEDCKGTSSPGYTSSQNPIPAPFAGRVMSARIVDPPNYGLGSGIGLVFHQDPRLDYGGPCGRFIYLTSSIAPEQCFPVENGLESVYSADIIILPHNYDSSGEGVSFYSEDNGWNASSRSGFYDILPKQIPPIGVEKPVEKIVFNWTGTGREVAYQTINKTFKEKQGSIKIYGNYLVGIYSAAIECQQNNPNQPGYCASPQICKSGYCVPRGTPAPTAPKPDFWCQTFKKTVNNLGAESWKNPGYSLLRAEIVPIMSF